MDCRLARFAMLVGDSVQADNRSRTAASLSLEHVAKYTDTSTQNNARSRMKNLLVRPKVVRETPALILNHVTDPGSLPNRKERMSGDEQTFLACLKHMWWKGNMLHHR